MASLIQLVPTSATYQRSYPRCATSAIAPHNCGKETALLPQSLSPFSRCGVIALVIHLCRSGAFSILQNWFGYITGGRSRSLPLGLCAGTVTSGNVGVFIPTN